MIATILFCVVQLAPPSISLDTITLDHARAIHGRYVVATLIPTAPLYTLRGFTITGPDTREDDVERAVLLHGKRLDIELGKRLTVFGRLRVIDHEAARVGMVVVPRWVEIRIEE
jgi:hypothetical protein